MKVRFLISVLNETVASRVCVICSFLDWERALLSSVCNRGESRQQVFTIFIENTL